MHTWPGWRRQSIHERENELTLLCKNAKLFPSSFVFVSYEEALKLGTNFSSLCISRPTHARVVISKGAGGTTENPS